MEDIGQKIADNNIYNLITELSSKKYNTTKDIEKELVVLKRKYNVIANKRILGKSYNTYISNNLITPDSIIQNYLKVKETRGLSGVNVIAVITAPYPSYTDSDGVTKTQRFSCKHDCFYCPRELDENGKEKNARSYLSDEPTVARGLANDYDAHKQFMARGTQYINNGHKMDKLEIIVLGGTWTEYPREYQEEYIRDLFYTANIFKRDLNHIKRDKKTLVEEHKINETADVKIIGLTLEMRPDSINDNEILWLRYLGCTRVQLGIQHIDDKILKKVNRGCYLKDSIYALKKLKDYGYKVDAHWMPDLPDSSYDIDKKMFDYIIDSEDLQFDQWKIYPTTVVPWTKLKTWYDNNEYKSWVEENPEKLIELMIHVKEKIPYWIRINRLVRDIPNKDRNGELYIYGGNKVTNLRQVIENKMKKENKFCNCIRCREIKNQKINLKTQIVIRKYNSSGGVEYFISIESGNSTTSTLKNIDNEYHWYDIHDKKEKGIIYAFLRLRIPFTTDYRLIKEINDAALIRELHVYGDITCVNNNNNNNNKNNKNNNEDNHQHRGYGKLLLKTAEEIAGNKLNKIAVISGIGVKNYYRKFGYKEENTYMIKHNINYKKKLFVNILIVFTIIFNIILIYILNILNFFI